MNFAKAARSALPVGVVALVSTGLTPAAAETTTEQPTDKSTDESTDVGTETAIVTITERTLDRSGNVLDEHQRSIDYPLEQLEGGSTVIDGRPASAAPAGMRTAAASPTSSACRSIDVSMWVGRVYHFGPKVTFYVYNHNKRWCWNSGSGLVDGLYWYDYFTNVDALWYDRGQVRNESYWYPAWSGYPKSGHKSFTQRSIENCLVHCIGVHHPWADVHAFADGAYWFNLGT